LIITGSILTRDTLKIPLVLLVIFDAPQASLDIPLLFNREYMELLAQRLALIKSMRKEEEMESVVV